MPDRLYEVTLSGEFAGQQVINRWNYRGSGDVVPSGRAFGLASAMGFVPAAGDFPAGTLAKALKTFTNHGLTWNQCIVRAVYDALDFVDLPFVPVVAGTAGGDATSPFVAFGVRTNRIRTDIGRGYKRFAGVSDSGVSDKGVVEGGMLTLVQALCALMGNVLTFTESSLSMAYTPVIVKKTLYHPSAGHNAYRYDPDETTQMGNLAAGIVWEAYPDVRSQTSRQYGKGR
jgi:hypothetical protein